MKKQYFHNDNWDEPYYIDRFYNISDEYIAKKIGYNIKVVALHIDAFMQLDNAKIPIMQAVRIVSLIQDENLN